MSVEDEIEQLARELAVTDQEDVRDSADIIIANYKRKRPMLDALDQVNDMAGIPGGSLDRAREELRDRLKALLAWAKQTGRM
jgi:hypothetical protein